MYFASNTYALLVSRKAVHICWCWVFSCTAQNRRHGTSTYFYIEAPFSKWFLVGHFTRKIIEWAFSLKVIEKLSFYTVSYYQILFHKLFFDSKLHLPRGRS